MHSPTVLAGRYRLERTLAAGGMGQVWIAHDTLLGRDVAVKVQPVPPDEDAEALERFRREAQAMGALHHPNVVTVFDGGIDGSRAFIVMELLSGPTLAEYVTQHGPLPEADARRFAAAVAAGLAAAHEAGVVHRDVKPGNLVFDRRGTLKIVDFGIARLSHASGTRLTRDGAVIGSVAYLAPEQVEGGTADERTDLYALGCVLTLMLTGRPPFEGEHPVAVAQQHVHRDAAPVGERRPGVSADLGALVQSLLAKSPDARPGSAIEVLARLSARPAAVATPSVATRAALTTGPPATGTRIMGPPATGTPIIDAPAAGTPNIGAPTTALPAPAPPPRAESALPAAIAVGSGGGGLDETREMRFESFATAQESGRSQRSPARPWWIPAVVLALGAVLLGIILIPLFGGDDAPASGGPAAVDGAGTTPASQASTSSIPTSSATTTTRPTTTKATTSTPTASPTTRSPLAVLRAAVDSAIASGQVNPRRAQELKQRFDAVAGAVRQGDTRDARRQIRDMTRYVDELSRRHQITSSAAGSIRTALRRLSASL
jgi:hypothetical protein